MTDGEEEEEEERRETKNPSLAKREGPSPSWWWVGETRLH